MFDLDTSIHIVGHVLIAVCVEDFLDWWHHLYATTLIVAVFMRFHLSWLESSICQTFPATMEILIYYISSPILEIMVLCISSSWIFWSMYIVRRDDHICDIMYYAYSWPLYSYVSRTAICTCSYMQICIIVLCWLGGWSSIWDPSSRHFWDGLIMYFGHRMTPLTSHIRGICYSWFYHTWWIAPLWSFLSLCRLFRPHVPFCTFYVSNIIPKNMSYLLYVNFKPILAYIRGFDS